MERVERFDDHPAVQAWNKLDSHSIVPQNIEVLKKGRKILVLLLTGTDRGDPIRVIAKGAKHENISTENYIYRDVLSRCDFLTPRYYGFVQNSDDDFSWLFIDEARGQFYDHGNLNHCRAALEWLAALHTSKLSSSQRSMLPDRDLDSYYQHMLLIDKNIQVNRSNKALTNEHLNILSEIASSLEEVKSIWDEIRNINTMFPLTFVHGDLKDKNVRIQNSGSKTNLVVFDWEMAGWGLSSVDFGEMIFHIPRKELAYYLDLIDIPSSPLVRKDFIRFVQAGRLLRLITSIYWESRRLRFQWVSRPLERIKYYQQGIYETLMKWENQSL